MIQNYEVRNKIIKDHFIQFGFMIFIFIIMNFILKDINAFTVFYGTVIIYFVSNFYNPKKYLSDIIVIDDKIEFQYLSSYFRKKVEILNIDKIKVVKFEKASFFAADNNVIFYLDFDIENFIVESIQTKNKLDMFIKNNNIELKK